MKTCGLTPVPSSGASDRKAIKSRVFNGDIAQLGDFPWMTSIKVQNESYKFECGGALNSDHWILTSARFLTHLALSAFRIF
jgi:secreted trypsin-like serine protease